MASKVCLSLVNGWTDEFGSWDVRMAVHVLQHMLRCELVWCADGLAGCAAVAGVRIVVAAGSVLICQEHASSNLC